jgi:hypothetical protein
VPCNPFRRLERTRRAVRQSRTCIAITTPEVRNELYDLDGSFRTAAAVPSNAGSLSVVGRNVVFATGHVIRRMDAKTGAVTVLAMTLRKPVGLTIEGRRVVWAENVRGSARLRAVTAP